MITVQKIRKGYELPIEAAMKYYSIISVLNNLNLTEKQIELLSFTCIKRTISSLAYKKEFASLFGGSVAYVNNMIRVLVIKGLLVKIDRKYVVNPAIDIQLQDGLLLQIKLDINGGSDEKAI